MQTFEYKDIYSTQWSRSAPALVKYNGDKSVHHLEVPEAISGIEADVFKGMDIRSMTLKVKGCPAYAARKTVRGLSGCEKLESLELYLVPDVPEALTRNDKGEGKLTPNTQNMPMSAYSLCQEMWARYFPELKHITVTLEGADDMGIVNLVDSAYGIPLDGDIHADYTNAAGITGGKVMFRHNRFLRAELPWVPKNMRVEVVRDTIEHKEEYPEEVYERRIAWLRKNAHHLVYDVHTNIVDLMRVCFSHNISFSYGFYKNLVEYCDGREDAESVSLKAEVLGEIGKHIDVDKEKEREERKNIRKLEKPESAFAQKDGWNWETAANGNVRLTKCKISHDGDIYVPDTIGRRKVTAIGSTVFSGKWGPEKYKGIHIPETVTTFENGALANIQVKKLVVPGSVKILSMELFKHANIDELVLPEGVEEVRVSAFEYTKTNLKVFDGTHVKTLGYHALQNSPFEKVVFGPALKSIGEGAMHSSKHLTEVVLPEVAPTPSLPDMMFSGCSSLERVNIPRNIAFIGECCFDQCQKLKKLDIPDEVESILKCAFYQAGIESFVQPKSLRYIGYAAFEDTQNLKALELHDVLVEGDAFMCSALETVTLNNITTIPKDCFRKCRSLKNVTMNGVKRIMSGAFCGCTSLEEVRMSVADDVFIDETAFDECTNMKKIFVKLIGGDDVLRKIQNAIPDGVEIIVE